MDFLSLFDRFGLPGLIIGVLFYACRILLDHSEEIAERQAQQLRQITDKQAEEFQKLHDRHHAEREQWRITVEKYTDVLLSISSKCHKI